MAVESDLPLETKPFLMFWIGALLAIVAFVIYNKTRKPAGVLDDIAKTSGIPKEILQMIGEDENKTQSISNKSIPGAKGPYGLSPDNPICCGNIMRMESTYSRIKFNGVFVREKASDAFYVKSRESGIESRQYNHTEDSGIPPIYITKEFHYVRCRDEAPDAPGFSM